MYVKHAQRAAELRDQEQLAWAEVVRRIAQETGDKVSPGTAVRAYDFHHRQAGSPRLDDSGCTRRGTRIGIGEDKQRRIRQLHAQRPAWSQAAIAKAVGCSRSTVGNVLRQGPLTSRRKQS